MAKETRQRETTYEIRLQGHLDARRLGRFVELTVEQRSNGETVLRCPVRDQAALHGLLARLEEMGATLLSAQAQPAATTRAMPLWLSLLCFGVPSAFCTASVYLALPALERAGASPFWSFWLALVGPMALILVAALVGYRLEGNPWSWVGLKVRFRLQPIRGRDWLWTAALVVSVAVYYLLHQTFSRWLASLPPFTPPATLPALLDPRATSMGLPTDLLGVPLTGNWWVIAAYIVLLSFNIFGEELWWRGYILPRQELAHGQYTWLVHGTLWALLHVFWKWDVLAIWPGALFLSYVAYRLKNTTPAIVAHWTQNGIALLALVLGVLGVTW